MTSILVVDDDEPIRDLMGGILEIGGYQSTLAADAREARELLKIQNFELILCDINMPGESGLEFVQYAATEYPNIAAVMVTAMDDPMLANHALNIGVYEYIIKPFEQNGVLISVRNALHRRRLEIDNRTYRARLEKKVEKRTADLQDSMEKLQKSLEGSIQAIARTVETRDPYTAGHQQRVAELAGAIAGEMRLSDEVIYGIRMGGLIHDLGKVSIPAEILTKPGRITQIEFELIKTHPKVGYDILKSIEFPWPIAKMVLQHHERMDGSGYPAGLKGSEIIPEARILGVADVVEAMASHRPYRPSLGIDKALNEISEKIGGLYDPDASKACLRLFRQRGYVLD